MGSRTNPPRPLFHLLTQMVLTSSLPFAVLYQREKAISNERDRLFCFASSGLTTGSGQWLPQGQAGETLRLGHFFGLWSFRALRHFKLDFLTLFEGLETVALNGAVVNEDVRRAWLLNEAIALRVVKPLDLTGYSRHTNESS